MTAMLEVDGLQVRYGPVVAVRGISFTVEEGELVALVGPNGAGKSSTLAALAGLRRDASGAVMVGGQQARGVSPEGLVRRGLVLVPEGRHIFGSLTVVENLKVGASARGDGAAHDRDMAWVLGIFPSLRELLPKTAGSLSGGEQQQLAIARALMSRPRLLMLDEPSLGLSPLLVERVFDTIATLREEHGMSLLLVEQNARAATELADRTFVLSQGKIVLSGTRAALAGSEEFERAFLGF
jgi:branched-chain amino acid transport system ATP-binding protein